MFKKVKVFVMAIIAVTTVISYIPVYGENNHGEKREIPCVDRTELFKKTLKWSATQGNTNIEDTGVIDISKAIRLSFDLKVPVIGDYDLAGTTPVEGEYINKGDCASILVSKDFKVKNNEAYKLQSAGGDFIATVNLVNTPEGLVANFIFDGDDHVYNGDRAAVSGELDIDLHYSGDPNFNEGDNKKVVIIDREFDLSKPKETVDYTISKDGNINKDNDGFNWKVIIDGSKTDYSGTNKLDFAGFKFEDVLTDAGVLDVSSIKIKVNGVYVDASNMYDDLSKTLSYEFLEGDLAPIEITYETKMTEDEILSNGTKKITVQKLLKMI